MSVKILIVDDDDEIRRVLRLLLKQTGYDLLEAPEAGMAFQLLRDHRGEVGVVICDLRLPKVTGIDILEQIKLEFGTLPVVILTGLIDLSSAVEAMKKGAFDYLTKPIKKDDLILVIEKALNQKKLLDDYTRLQQKNQELREGLHKVIEPIAKELESLSLQLKKIGKTC